MLCVDLVGHGQRDAAQFVARRIQHLAAEIQESTERATRDAARDVHRAGGRLQRQAQALRIDRIGGCGQRRGGGAEHQRLAVADEDVQRRVAFGDGRHAHLAGELVDEQVALVEQVVGRVAGVLHRHRDVAIQARDALRHLVDLAGFGRELDVHAFGHFPQAGVVGLEALRQRIDACESSTWRAEMELGVLETSLMASVNDCSEVPRPFDVLPSRSSRRSASEAKASRRARLPPDVTHLLRDELVVDAANGVRVDAGAYPVLAIGLGLARGEIDRLAGIARRRDVRDVVGSRIQRALKRTQDWIVPLPACQPLPDYPRRFSRSVYRRSRRPT